MSVYSLNTSSFQSPIAKVLTGTYSSGYIDSGAVMGKGAVQYLMGELWAWASARHEPTAPSAQVMPPALLEFAYMKRLEAIKAEPGLERYFTMEHAAKAAYLEVARESLSDRANARLCRLAKSPENWDGEGARAMSISAVANFVAFFVRGPQVSKEMDIFLGFCGEIITSWILADGSTLDMSFGDSHIELATDQHDEVFSVDDDRLYQLIHEL